MTRHSSLDKYVLLQFKTGLRERQRELRQGVDKAEREIREFSDSVPLDPIDASCFNSSKESMFARASHYRIQLRRVELALERIQNGSFGTCSACDGGIGLKRLQAVPWADQCIQCQEQSEVGSLERANSLRSLRGGALQDFVV